MGRSWPRRSSIGRHGEARQVHPQRPVQRRSDRRRPGSLWASRARIVRRTATDLFSPSRWMTVHWQLGCSILTNSPRTIDAGWTDLQLKGRRRAGDVGPTETSAMHPATIPPPSGRTVCRWSGYRNTRTDIPEVGCSRCWRSVGRTPWSARDAHVPPQRRRIRRLAIAKRPATRRWMAAPPSGKRHRLPGAGCPCPAAASQSGLRSLHP